MQGVPSRHPPGIACILSGDLTRYAVSMQCINVTALPQGSAQTWDCSVLIATTLNQALKRVLDSPKYQWAWLMGDDHVFPADIVIKLLDREVDCVAPLCLNRVPPMDPTIINHTLGRMKNLTELPTYGLYRLADDETVGDAGLLVRRRVLETVPYPWYDHRRSGSLASEDQAFTGRIREAGFGVFVDLDNPIGHIGQVTYQPVLDGGKWRTRLTGGLNHICDLDPVPRT